MHCACCIRKEADVMHCACWISIELYASCDRMGLWLTINWGINCCKCIWFYPPEFVCSYLHICSQLCVSSLFDLLHSLHLLRSSTALYSLKWASLWLIFSLLCIVWLVSTLLCIIWPVSTLLCVIWPVSTLLCCASSDLYPLYCASSDLYPLCIIWPVSTLLCIIWPVSTLLCVIWPVSTLLCVIWLISSLLCIIWRLSSTVPHLDFYPLNSKLFFTCIVNSFSLVSSQL